MLDIVFEEDEELLITYPEGISAYISTTHDVWEEIYDFAITTKRIIYSYDANTKFFGKEKIISESIYFDKIRNFNGKPQISLYGEDSDVEFGFILVLNSGSVVTLSFSKIHDLIKCLNAILYQIQGDNAPIYEISKKMFRTAKIVKRDRLDSEKSIKLNSTPISESNEVAPNSFNQKPESVSSSIPRPVDSRIDSIKQIICSRCGKPMSPESSFCPHCGQQLQNGVENISFSKPNSVVSIQVLKCPCCGSALKNPNNLPRITCEMCDSELIIRS